MIKFSRCGGEREVDLNDKECEFVKFVFEMLQDKINTEKLEIVRKSDSYATIVMRGKTYDFDLIRFKYTDKTRWLSLSLSKNDRKDFENDPLFHTQKKKSQLHWKSEIQNLSDICIYKDLIVNSYIQCIEMNKENFT